MSFKMKCPNCQKVLNVTEKAFGKSLPCPACQRVIKVPESADSTARATSNSPQSDLDDTGQQTSADCPPQRVPEAQPPAAPKNPALRQCPDCNAQISRNAASCPHCGCPLKTAPAEARQDIKIAHGNPVSAGFGMAMGSILAMLLLFVLMIVLCTGCPLALVSLGAS